MKMAFLILPLISGIMATYPAIGRMQITGETAVSRPAPQPVTVVSMGQVEAIDYVNKRLQINGVSYAFDPATSFFDVAGHRTQSTRLQAGDWINFWIKPGSTQATPTLVQVALIRKP